MARYATFFVVDNLLQLFDLRTSNLRNFSHAQVEFLPRDSAGYPRGLSALDVAPLFFFFFAAGIFLIFSAAEMRAVSRVDMEVQHLADKMRPGKERRVFFWRRVDNTS